MAKDYFQDITPPDGNAPRPAKSIPVRSPDPLPPREPLSSSSTNVREGEPVPPERTIRNIPVTPRVRPRIGSEDVREPEIHAQHVPSRVKSYALWGAVAVVLIVLIGIGLLSLRPTTVTVVPRAQGIVFDESARFVAYPAASAATGTLSFTVEEKSFDDSQLVPAKGTEHVEERASGTITVYNEYSSQPQKLIKNTRFETPNGLMFRTPAEVMVPGKKSGKAGVVKITVIAGSPGEEYNVGPVSRFTLPGLKSSADMYKGLYGTSDAAMSGGFKGDRPAVEGSVLEGARAEIRGRLREKLTAMVHEHTTSTFAFPSLSRITFESLPPTNEGEKGVRLNERMTVSLPIFPADALARVIAESVSADARMGDVTLKADESLDGNPSQQLSANFSQEPLPFTLKGQGQLVWRVDTGELASALAGKDKSAFQTIVAEFTSVAEARSRVQPFWKNSFPADPSAIKITVEDPPSAK